MTKLAAEPLPPRVARFAHAPGLELVHFAESSKACRWIPESFTGFIVSPRLEGDVDVLASGRRAAWGPRALSVGVPGEPWVMLPRAAMRGEFRVVRIDNDVRDALLAELDVSPAPSAFPARPQRDPKLVRAFLRLFRALDGGESLETSERLLFFLASVVARGDRTPKIGRASTPAVRRARDLLHARFGEEIALGELARAAGADRFALLRSFSKELGLTPYAYQVRLRVARACRLIRQGRALADVALEVGYSEQSALGRPFRRIVGVTPGAYARATR